MTVVSLWLGAGCGGHNDTLVGVKHGAYVVVPAPVSAQEWMPTAAGIPAFQRRCAVEVEAWRATQRAKVRDR